MELLEQFARGDREAFEVLFRQFQNEVYGWIIRIVRDPGIAEDLTIETFWRIYRAHARFDPARSFGAWARRVATNVALDYLRNVRPKVEFVEFSEDFSQGPLSNPAVQQDIRDRIGRAFRQLPAKLQVVATLALIEEEPYEDIAEALGIPVGTVKSRVFRATRLLRKKLKRLGVEP
jgi:RNA polymerase sigma factor (sigma-70 family)